MRITMALSMRHMLLSLLLCFLLHETAQAIKQSYIVYLGSHSLSENPSLDDVKSVTNSHYDLLGSYVGSIEKAEEAIFYSYNRYINGFAAILDEEDAAKIAEHPKVLSVFPNKRRELHTTRSWSFLNLERNGAIPKNSIWRKTLGQDVIIGNLDTGVWPESKSFSDKGMGPIPKRWRGTCQTDEKNTDKFHCNRKLIGARYFDKGYKANTGSNESFYSARDYEGHGSHTLSTAGGIRVRGANVFGHGNGTATGGSPKARVAAYKVCWPQSLFLGGCYDADILAGFEAAIGDGVDVLSVSLGSDSAPEFSKSSISIGSFHAVSHGIVVVASAGNSGPSPFTVSNYEPWVLTVAASTIDREFTSYVTLGDNKILRGASLSEYGLPSAKSYPLISGADAKSNVVGEMSALLCEDGALEPKKAKGKILVCLRGENSRIDKGMEAARVGAVGMILANDDQSGNEIIADPHVLPASNVNFTDGAYIFSYINRTKSPLAYISRVKAELGIKPAPFVASFSSRGPNFIEPTILKPDVTAPGVNIIAAYSEAISPTEQKSDKRRIPFNILSGTSMSCPHVSGLVGLLKSLHPDWSPAAIKSSIMTTAKTKDNTGRPMLNSTLEKATPFDYGAGHIRPNRAADPGLVYDLTTIDYLNFLCGHGYNNSLIKLFYNKDYTCPKLFNIADLNYPSIGVSFIDNRHSQTVTRTLTNVGPPSTYKVRVKAPPETLISVEPSILNFKEKGEKKAFKVTLTLRPLTKYMGDYFFGGLDWTDGKHHVRSPVVIKYPY